MFLVIKNREKEEGREGGREGDRERRKLGFVIVVLIIFFSFGILWFYDNFWEEKSDF